MSRSSIEIISSEHVVTETGAVRAKEYAQEGEFPIRLDLILQNYVALRRLGETFGEGSLKYPPGNWMKGFKQSVLLNHAMEHLRLYMAGDTKEDHLAHACWNLMSLMWFEEKGPASLFDLLLPSNRPVAKEPTI